MTDGRTYLTYEIFICYKRITAADFATHLKTGLEELGYRTFLDATDIPMHAW